MCSQEASTPALLESWWRMGVAGVDNRQQTSARRDDGLQKLCLWTKVGHLGRRETVRARKQDGDRGCASGQAADA